MSCGGPVAGEAVVTIIEMNDVAKVVLARHPIDANLAAFLRSRGKARARSHGNYLPALDLVLQIGPGMYCLPFHPTCVESSFS